MSGGNDGQLQIILDQLAQLNGQPRPPTITPDQLAMGQSSISQLLKILGIAANSGDAADMSAAEDGYAERDAKTGDALTKFPANEEESAGKLSGVGGQNEMAQMAQQLPQMASGFVGIITGALGGLLQPLEQIPQQVAQVGQQAMQAGMGAMQHGVEGAAGAGLGSIGAGGGAGALDSGAGGAGGGLAATTPTAMLGPLPAPSAGTEPAASHTTSSVPSPASTPSAAPRGAMGAMPMVPPGAMHGAGGTGSGDAKPDTKRVVAPAVKNGAPVQGRITTPPPNLEVTKRVEGKPVASRRILLPDYKRDDDADSSR